MRETDFLIVGGGIVGACIAWGLARTGLQVTLLDEGDTNLRAARGNLGQIWVQGKGATCPAYADLTREAARDWRAFAALLSEESGIAVPFAQEGAVLLCHSAEELSARVALLTSLNEKTKIPSRFEALSSAGLRRLIPALSEEVVGGTYSPDDGHTNPLLLLRALLKAFQARGGQYLPHNSVTALSRSSAGYRAETREGSVFEAGRIVLTAGLQNATLAPQLGLTAPVRPVRGQILVTERLQPFLRVNLSSIRQTADGTVVFGESSEEAGFSTETTLSQLRSNVARSVKAMPVLRDARVVRAWGALRIMTPDGVPVYASDAEGGASVISVHSGVTLAPFHANQLAADLAKGPLTGEFYQTFSPERFHAASH